MVQEAVWIVQAPFNAMHFVNDGRSLPEAAAPDGGRLKKQNNNTVEFHQVGYPSGAKSFWSYEVVADRALRSFRYGEDLFADYGNIYELN